MANNSTSFTEKIKYAAVMVAKAVPFALVGAGAFAALTSWRKKKPQLLKRSTSLALLHGGDMALERLVEYHEARADAQRLALAECELTVAFNNEEKPDFRKLTRIIAKLEMSGKEDKAIQTLEKELQNALKNGKSHEAYEIEMLLVEMLIYKGDFQKALSGKCLTDEKISDARRPLYKAIIHFMLEPSKKEAKVYWEKFIELKAHFGFHPEFRASLEETGTCKTIFKFEDFEKVVNKLQADIKKARERKSSV